MNKNIFFNKTGLLAVLFSMTLMACNKDVDQPVPNTIVLPSGPTIAAELAKNPEYSFLLAIINKVGLGAAVADSSKVFTVFAPDNNAIRVLVNAATGGLIPTNAPEQILLGFIATADSATTVTLSRIVYYHIIPGQAIKASAIKEDFANTQYPSNFIFPAPNTNSLVRFSSFVSRRQNAAWVNNIPVSKPDFIIGSNGVVHGIPAVLVPPARLLLDTIARDPDFTYLVAAIQKADSGKNVNILQDSSFQFFLGNPQAAPVVNFTVFAPNNQAFQNLIYGLVYSKVLADTRVNDPVTGDPVSSDTALAQSAATGAVAEGPAFLNNNVSTQLLRGVLAYHVIPFKRAFSVNFPGTPTDFPTFFNVSFPPHPGLKISSNLNNGFGVGLSVKGLKNPTAANATLTPLGIDRHAVNGVFFKIDQVLLPL